VSTAEGGSADRDVERVLAGRQAVGRWAGFPMGADPRPLILLDGPVRVDDGFATGDAKIAFLQGVVEAADGVADEAVGPLREATVRGPHPPRAPLQVTAAVRSLTEFSTDRGPEVCLRGGWRRPTLWARSGCSPRRSVPAVGRRRRRRATRRSGRMSCQRRQWSRTAASWS
jgi:hypothetical protein